MVYIVHAPLAMSCLIHWYCLFAGEREREREREMFYLTTHSTHFSYGYMASDIWLRTILIVRKETRCRHVGYSFRLTARVLLYAPSNRQDSTYHGLCYTSRGALAGTRISSMGYLLKDVSALSAWWKMYAGYTLMLLDFSCWFFLPENVAVNVM